MGANVAHRVKLIVSVPRNDYWLVETTFKKSEGPNGTRHLDGVHVTRPLPTLRKNPFLARLEQRRILVELGWQSTRVVETWVDGKGHSLILGATGPGVSKETPAPKG